ncbi:MAG: hypothetical protein ABIS50_14795 [Luteolibacter sp.]|uniref:hypothetical protein n=1 Tax=Luteolibacter sp. TaxID=1962973 RepID=UPI003266371C
MPTLPTPQPVVICADALRDLYPKSQMKAGIKAACICSPFFLLGTLLKMEWLGVIGIGLVFVLFVVPHILRIKRFLASLPCSVCGLPAGRHTTVNLIMHLECEHCGHLSRTDCLMFGHTPTKV